MIVTSIKPRKIFASNTKFTLEVEMNTDVGKVVASVPIGTSRGTYEALYLPIQKAIEKVKEIRRFFVNEVFKDIIDVDRTLRLIDKTDNFSNIGGNVSLAFSYAFLKAFSIEEGKMVYEYISEIAKTKPNIPKPISNVIGGGEHGGSTEIQEFHILPMHQESFLESITKIAKIYRDLGLRLKKKDPFFSFSRNLESAWTTRLNHEKILSILSEFTDENYRIGLDVAANHMWDRKKEKYVYKSIGMELNTQQQIEFIMNMAKMYPVSFIEDPFHENDFISFGALTSILPGKIICGDDLYVTNVKRLKQGIDIKSTNAVLVKPNQIGTIMDTIEFVKLAKKNGMMCVLSHRSAETEDVIMSHIAVGLGCDFIKLGIAGERAIKINEVIRIEESINRK